jgi:streptogramin lyase
VTQSIGRVSLPSGQITEFPVSLGLELCSITVGPDGNVWFVKPYGDVSTIGKITPSGTITEIAVPGDLVPSDITAGPDGNLWFPAEGLQCLGKVGRVTPNGVIDVFDLPDEFCWLSSGITEGPDGALWFTAIHAIGRITVDGVVTRFPVEGATYIQEITAGLDKTLWFTADDTIGRVTTSGDVTLFPLAAGSTPLGITLGPDGNVWFAERDANKLGWITPAGVISEWTLPRPDSEPTDITSTSNGRLVFTESATDRIGGLLP